MNINIEFGLLSGLDEEARQKFMEVLSIMNQNLDDILK